MKSAQHLANKNTLWAYIKRLGEFWNEDDAFAKEYGKDVYNEYTEDLEACLKCFSSLVEQTRLLGGKKYRGH